MQSLMGGTPKTALHRHQAWLSSGHARQISVRHWLSARAPRLPEFATLS
ncbi:hypothetical protein [Moorena producens]|nr:hypothetical protein [Moorena producens]